MDHASIGGPTEAGQDESINVLVMRETEFNTIWGYMAAKGCHEPWITKQVCEDIDGEVLLV